VNQPKLPRVPRRTEWRVSPLGDRGAAQVAADEIRRVMWEQVGISRDAKGLTTARKALDALRARLTGDMTEELNMVDTARLIVASALKRKESRGGHFRRDFPKPRNAWRGKHIEW
jgi:L-aspartate oxidase